MSTFNFDEKFQTVQLLDGMLSQFSATVIDTLLMYQQNEAIHGDMLEFGCYKGKTALLLGLSLEKNQKILLIDSVDTLNKEVFYSNNVNFEFYNLLSKNFRKTLQGGFRFIHCDSSHFFNDTLHELTYASTIIGDRGIIAVDDFANLHHPGVIAAVYKFIFDHKDFRLFLITDEKAYICRNRAFFKYNNFVKHQLPIEMKKRGTAILMARTDNSPYSCGTFIRGNTQGENLIYGQEIYSQFWEDGRTNKNFFLRNCYRVLSLFRFK